ncbi:unnamed protein product [Gordionus sp. m RMFG-2023]|uniref:cytochrome b-c1 complex subunit 7-like n=1 Tax=Gordionus sp. m RMFG-2023 TaxID=3053472 RepID=UPI0030E21DA5
MSHALKSGSGVFRSSFNKFKFEYNGYNKYGLLYDDLYHDFNPIVLEAVRRLPDDLFHQRQHRQMRAIYLSMQKATLPKEQWVKYEDDKPYLKSYIKEVQDEIKEKDDWNSR